MEILIFLLFPILLILCFLLFRLLMQIIGKVLSSLLDPVLKSLKKNKKPQESQAEKTANDAKNITKYRVLSIIWFSLFVAALLYSFVKGGIGGAIMFFMVGLPFHLIVFFVPLSIFLNKSNLSYEEFLAFMKSRSEYLFTGLFFVSLGVEYLNEGWDWEYGVYVPEETGWLFIFGGVVFIIFGLVKKTAET